MKQGYKPRRFDESPLFKVVYQHFENFQDAYYRTYSQDYGFFRHIITHTIERYLTCGDPREGIARYECPRCNHSIAVPFSCKTRLFCPTCHELKILLWVEDIQKNLLLDVPHRFCLPSVALAKEGTFSIPKRLRYYFMRNRKLLSLMVDAANFALTAPLTGGRMIKNLRPGIISLIQTHSDSLEFNCHLHMIVTDGLVDYGALRTPQFQPVRRWDGAVITEVFRWRLLKSLVKKRVILPEVADNMLSWPHSGFNVHATAPFRPDDAELVKNRLAYAFRPPVALSRLDYDGTTVLLTTTKRVEHKLTPFDFLAKITLHIPNRYQNIRRYAGFYASNIQRRVRDSKKENGDRAEVEDSKPIKPKWAALISQIFGAIPIECPRCKSVMELKEFILEENLIKKHFPDVARAPPQKTFEQDPVADDDVIYVMIEGNSSGGVDYNQTSEEIDIWYDQTVNW
jgi:hypothetical protein